MTSLVSPSSSFSALTSPGDAIAVLVLVETSGAMSNYWEEIKGFYLPVLLDTLRNAHDIKTVPMRVCWQTSQTVFSGNQTSSPGDATGKEIPDFRFDPASTSAVSTTALRYSIETLKAAFRDRSATRHFIVVAASSPLDDSNRTIRDPNALEPIAAALRQEKIRLHMILGPVGQTQMHHQLHHQVLQPQNCRAVPLWFSADISKFSILLMGKPPSSFVEAHSTNSNVASGSSQSSGTPISTGSSLPSSPILQDPYPGTDRRKSMSPQNRRGKPGTTEQPAHGLVSYLQQMHGLTKKRTYGGTKPAKRASTGDTPRSSSSIRPILPRLDVPEQKSRGFSPYPTMGSPNAGQPLVEASTTSAQRYMPIAPASLPSSPSEENRRSRSRWPWLQPAPLRAVSSGSSNTNPSAVNALRSLAMMTPRHPELAARLPDLSPVRNGPMHPTATQLQGAMTPDSDAVFSMPFDSHPNPGATEWFHRQRSSTIATSNPQDYRMSATPSPTHTPHGYESPWVPGAYTHHTHGYPSHDHLTHTHDHASFPHMHHPPPLLQQGNADNPEDQPFLITPEFEALANARFEAAVRSGAMQASMTAATLGPVSSDRLTPTPAAIPYSAREGQLQLTMTDIPPPQFPREETSTISPSDPPTGLQGSGGQAPGIHPGQGHSGGNTADPTQDRWYGM
ncbi:hypothetical protein BXZ70DRAFT_919614 [Cristinia sonorae]|uniref:Uncharacterized protein n=1 Tax=Cristinia sonorae TaxID=1940300 RepID=A0A8K0XT27_9AGAR|nr:hypothetical protein BXZ70DRAFT_919614 [Cristinia sonorae]